MRRGMSEESYRYSGPEAWVPDGSSYKNVQPVQGMEEDDEVAGDPESVTRSVAELLGYVQPTIDIFFHIFDKAEE